MKLVKRMLFCYHIFISSLKAMYESGKEIVATVLSAMGQEAIIQVKESNETK